MTRLEELEKLIEKNRGEMSKRSFSSWTIFSNEYHEYNVLKAAEETRIAQQERAQKPQWQDQPATDRQRDYLKKLGVDIYGKELTKEIASSLIDVAKNGESVGYLGFQMIDGSR